MTTDPKDAEIARLMAERRMIVSHATMGQTDGEGLSVNAISVKISALRNELYQDGAARAEKAEAALAENEAAAEGALMILLQTQAERDAEIARMREELHEMTRSRDEWRNDFRALEKAIVGDTGLSAMTVAVQARLFRPRAEKAEAERDAALARESALLASNQSKRELLYKLTGAQSEVIHVRNRFDTAVATARAEGRKEGLQEAAEWIESVPQSLPNRQEYASHLRALAEKEAQG